jgi:hypothetical protein
MNRSDRWLPLVLLLTFGFMVVVAFRYPPEARLAPVAVGLLGIALCFVQLAFDGSSTAAFAARFRPAPKLGRPFEPSDVPGETRIRGEFAMWGYFLAFVTALLMLGFYIATPTMVFAYLWRQARVKLPYALAAAIGATGSVYLVFEGIFHFVLFRGFAISAALQALSQ